MYKKILLSSAIAVAMGTAGFASANVDLPNQTGSVSFSSETTIPSGGVVLELGEAGAAVDTTVGFSIGAGTSKYVRYDFDSELAGAITVGMFSFTDTAAPGAAAVAQFSISQGGAAGDDYVIVEVAAQSTGADIQQDDVITFAPDTGTQGAPVVDGIIQADAQVAQNISYAIYEFAAEAISESNALKSFSAKWFDWKSGLNATCQALNADRIDVTNPTQFVDGVQSTDILRVNASAVTGVYTTAGIQVAATDYLNGADVAIEGNFEAFTAGVTFNSNAATLAADELSASLTNQAVPLNNALLNVTADTNDDIVPSSYSVSLTSNAATGQFDVGTLEFDNCGALRFSGSTDRLDFALTPGGIYKQWVRITNPSDTTGDVRVTVVNDLGEEASFPLGAIAGADTSLVGGASTDLLTIEDVYAAAQGAESDNPAFDANGGKLRIVVRGEFGDNAIDGSGSSYATQGFTYDGPGADTNPGTADDTYTLSGSASVTRNAGEVSTSRLQSGIYIQGVTTSRDGNAFYQTK